jgi:hypothetical protein
MTRDEIDELADRLSSDIASCSNYGPWTRHGIVIIGVMLGITVFMFLIAVELLTAAPIPQNISGTGLTLVAILFSMAGGLILPSVRVMEAEETFLQEFPDHMRLDLRLLEARRDLPAEAKPRLRDLIVQNYQDGYASRMGIPFRRMSLATTARWLLPEASFVLVLLFLQPYFPPLYYFAVFLLAVGYATAFMALALVYRSVEKTLRGKWIQR